MSEVSSSTAIPRFNMPSTAGTFHYGHGPEPAATVTTSRNMVSLSMGDKASPSDFLTRNPTDPTEFGDIVIGKGQDRIGTGTGHHQLHGMHHDNRQQRQRRHSKKRKVNKYIDDDDHESCNRNLFGDLPVNKRRRFLLVEDEEKCTKARVRVSLDQVKMDEMPDQHLRMNAVFPRSCYPRVMRSPTPVRHRVNSGAEVDVASNEEEDDDDDDDGHANKIAMARVASPNGSVIQLPVPGISRTRRNAEVSLNEIGYRLSWGQARIFNERRLFLQRAVDAYRERVYKTVVDGGGHAAAVANDLAPHFEVRPGKRKWLERMRRMKGAADIPDMPIEIKIIKARKAQSLKETVA